MSELLLELYSEEIPPNLQLNAKKNLHEKIKSLLNDINLKFESIDSFSSPTRLVIIPAKTSPEPFTAISVEEC